MRTTRLPAAALLSTALLSTALAAAGCQKIVQEIDTPGPPPPYDPAGARIDPKLLPDKPPAADSTPTPTSADATPVIDLEPANDVVPSKELKKLETSVPDTTPADGATNGRP